jgi:hypothetical protein
VNLAELEQYFARAATSGTGPLPDLDRVFVGSERLSATDRLAIYNRGYFYRLLDALASVFSQTKRLLGDSDFERLGLAYLARHPSDHPAVERVGRSFSEYLRGVGTPTLVVDVASLEWARLSALVAPNPASVASVNHIEAGSFPRARLRFVPSLHFLELDPRALPAFADAHSATDPRATDPLQAPCGVAVWRTQHLVVHESLSAAEWKALVNAAAGATLRQICSSFDTGSEPDAVQQAFQALSRWFAREWLEAVIASEP